METKNEEKKPDDQRLDQKSDAQPEETKGRSANENGDSSPEIIENKEEKASKSSKPNPEIEASENSQSDDEQIKITPLFDEEGNLYDDPHETKKVKPEQTTQEPADKAESAPKEKEEETADKAESAPEEKEEETADKAESAPEEKEEEPEVKVESAPEEKEEEPEVKVESAPEEKEEEPAVKAESAPEEKEEEPAVKAGAEADEKEESEESGDDDDDEEDHADYTSLNKEELVSALEDVVGNENSIRYRQKVGKIKLAFNNIINELKDTALTKFLTEGGKKEDFTYTQDDIENRFYAALLIYKEKKRKYIEELEEIKKENLVKKLEILDQIKELINSDEPLKKTYDEFRSIQDKWREIGNVPKSEISNLWQSYHFLVEKFFDKVKINNELRDLDMKKNMEKRIELCEKAEELLLETSVIRSFKQLQRYHQEWKDIGAVPHDKNDELWERFKSATDKINERRKSYYDKIYEEQENNFVAKRALCEKAEEILTNTPERMSEWQKFTDDINELMKMWKTLGPAPRQHNDEIYKRFKTTLDEFYRQKKNHYNAIKEEQINNYNLKLNICQQAEALAESIDWRETTQELIHLQQEWKSIGPVPRRHSDKIWKRFRKSCDTFFERKQEHFAGRKASEEDNLKKKEELIEKINLMEVGSNREESLNTIKEIQRQFIETGHVPFKKKNQVHNDFREAINKKLDQLKIDPDEITAHSYRIQLESKTGKDKTGKTAVKERSFILQKIKKLENDITLWENNMGFLADSAAADVLKNEFEKKINKSKDEIVLLNTKLKVLDESSKTKKQQ